MSYRSLIQFRVKQGKAETFEAAFAKAGMLERPKVVKGFVFAELTRSLSDPNDYAVVGEWESEQAYADWQAISREEADPETLSILDDCLVEYRPGRLFKPVLRSD